MTGGERVEPQATVMCAQCGAIRMVSPRWHGRLLRCAGCGQTTHHDLVPMRGVVDPREQRNKRDQEVSAANSLNTRATLRLLAAAGVEISWGPWPITSDSGMRHWGASMVRYADRPGVEWGVRICQNLTVEQLTETVYDIEARITMPSKWSDSFTVRSGMPEHWLCVHQLDAADLLPDLADGPQHT